jgi:hypothetical protein
MPKPLSIVNNKKYISLLAISLVAVSLAIAAPAFAQNAGQGSRITYQGRKQAPIFGTVSAVNGNVITLAAHIGTNGGTAVTYTVDATNVVVTKNGAASSVSNIAVGDTLVVQGSVNGTNVTAKTIRDGAMMPGLRNGMGVTGTVSAINGTSLTVTSRAMPNGGTAKTYTVDASSATVTKNGAASSVLNIAVGDTVMVQGTVNGTSVAAKTIRDGQSQVQPQIQGNGQPVVAGKVTVVSGNSITVTNSSNVTYTIDATGAKFVVSGITSPTISNIVIGDNLIVQGTVDGTSIVASSVIDQKVTAQNNTGNSASNAKPQDFMGGVMSGITNFFKHIFGF